MGWEAAVDRSPIFMGPVSGGPSAPVCGPLLGEDQRLLDGRPRSQGRVVPALPPHQAFPYGAGQWGAAGDTRSALSLPACMGSSLRQPFAQSSSSPYSLNSCEISSSFST